MQENDTIRIAPALRDALRMDEAPPDGLWLRIEAAHGSRRARRTRRRLGALAAGVALAALAGFGAVQLRAPHETVDWQARAEALETQLHALQRADAQVAAANGVDDLQTELGDIDRHLQTAYENGAAPTELAGLWKRRSELLDTLIIARKQNLLLTRI